MLQVGGYTIIYKGLTFATVRGAGHEVLEFQPSRVLTIFKSFLAGKLLPLQTFADGMISNQALDIAKCSLTSKLLPKALYVFNKFVHAAGLIGVFNEF